jgi:hypothetical protein
VAVWCSNGSSPAAAPAARSARVERAAPVLGGAGRPWAGATVGCVVVGDGTGATVCVPGSPVGSCPTADAGGVPVESPGPVVPAVLADAAAEADGAVVAVAAPGVVVMGGALLATAVIVLLGAGAAPATGLGAAAVFGAGAGAGAGGGAGTGWTRAAAALGRGVLRGAAAGSVGGAITEVGALVGGGIALVTTGPAGLGAVDPWAPTGTGLLVTGAAVSIVPGAVTG